VRRDLAPLTHDAIAAGAILRIPMRHLDSWVNALNQARKQGQPRETESRRGDIGNPCRGSKFFWMSMNHYRNDECHGNGRQPTDQLGFSWDGLHGTRFPSGLCSLYRRPDESDRSAFRGHFSDNSLTGRTSTLPTRAGGIFEANWMASFKSLASIR
jgi:hypothetical protein